MSVDSCFLYVLARPADRDAVLAVPAEAWVNEPIWHGDGAAFSMVSFVDWSALQAAPALTRVRLCLGAIPEAVFPLIERTAFAYADTTFADIARLNMAQIMDAQPLAIDFAGWSPGHPDLLADAAAADERIFASLQAMMAVEAYAADHTDFAAQLDQATDAAVVEALIRGVPELAARADVLAQDDYFHKRASGTLFAPAPLQLDLPPT